VSDVVDIARQLVAIGSVNPMGRDQTGSPFGEAALTDYLEAFFRRLGVPTQRQAVAPGRENLVATLRMPGARSTLLLEAHQDTVPVEGMTVDPFGGELRDGRVWGRGACDDKGPMAAMLAAVARLVREQPDGAASVVMACTVDEEHTFGGISRLLADPPTATMAIVAEPTQLEVVVAHKGVVRWKQRTHGTSAHSSTPERGENAVYRMAPVVAAMRDYARQLADRAPHPLLGPPTLSVGVIEGGTGVNVVPESCEIQIDRRLLPDEASAEAIAQVRHYLSERPEIDFAVEFGEPWIDVPGLETAADEPVVKVASTAVERVLGRAERWAFRTGPTRPRSPGRGFP